MEERRITDGAKQADTGNAGEAKLENLLAAVDAKLKAGLPANQYDAVRGINKDLGNIFRNLQAMMGRELWEEYWAALRAKTRGAAEDYFRLLEEDANRPPSVWG